MIEHLTAETFDAAVSSGVVLVDFWATWCGPCKMQGKILEDNLADLEAIGLKICKVNVDEAPALAERFGIMSIPTLQFFKDGVLKQQVVGIHNAGTLKSMIEKF